MYLRAAYLLYVAHCLFLNGGYSAGDIALVRLGAEKVHPLGKYKVKVRLVYLHEFRPELIFFKGVHQHLLCAGKLRGLAKHNSRAAGGQPFGHDAHGRVAGKAGGGIRLAAFQTYGKLAEARFLPPEAGGVAHEFHSLAGRHFDGPEVAVAGG